MKFPDISKMNITQLRNYFCGKRIITKWLRLDLQTAV